MSTILTQDKPDNQPSLDHLSDFRREVYDLLLPEFPAAAERYRKCGTFQDWVHVCPSCAATNPDFYAKRRPFSCMLSICQDCASTRMAPIRDRYRRVIEYLYAHPRKGWYVLKWELTRSVELTPASELEMQTTMELAADWGRRVYPSSQGCGVIIGGEVGEDGHKYHAHLIVYGPDVKHDEGSRVWREVTDGDFVVWRTTLRDADTAIREGLKYAVKAVSLSPALLVALYRDLRGTRRVRTYGIFYKSKHNPYAWLLEDEPRDPDLCPDCQSELRWMDADTYIAHVSLWWPRALYTIDEAYTAHKTLRVGLYLTDASKFARGSPI